MNPSFRLRAFHAMRLREIRHHREQKISGKQTVHRMRTVLGQRVVNVKKNMHVHFCRLSMKIRPNWKREAWLRSSPAQA